MRRATYLTLTVGASERLHGRHGRLHCMFLFLFYHTTAAPLLPTLTSLGFVRPPTTSSSRRRSTRPSTSAKARPGRAHDPSRRPAPRSLRSTPDRIVRFCAAARLPSQSSPRCTRARAHGVRAARGARERGHGVCTRSWCKHAREHGARARFVRREGCGEERDAERSETRGTCTCAERAAETRVARLR